MIGEDTGLQLPFDHLKIRGIATLLTAFVFDCPETRESERFEVLAAAAFGAQLARYTSQSSIPLITGSVESADRKLRWLDQLHFTTESEVTSEQLLTQARSHFASAHRANGSTPQHPAVLLSAHGPASIDEAQALALAECVPSAVRAAADLFLIVPANGSASRAAFVYNANLFERDTIARLVDHFQALLPQIAARASDPIARLNVLGAREEQAIRSAGEGESRPHDDIPVHRLIERWAAATPTAIAIKFKDQALTYEALNREANRLANHLIALRIGKESRVVVCVEGGFEVVIALLAILKAGAVYVPLDPTYPEARIRTILEDTQPHLVISRTTLVEKLPFGSFPVFSVDSDMQHLSDATENPAPPIDLQQTAYVFYTSGTTGKPKGVMASHANLIHYILVAQKRYGFTAHDVMPTIARFSFSISMFELMSPLAAGGTLIVLERDHVVDPARMAQTLQEVTFFHAGPSLLRVLVAYIRHRFTDFSVFDRVRHASSGGDMVPPELLESMKEIFSRAEVFVIYGCSEVSCMGCTYPVPRDRTVTRTYVGRPFENVVVRVLDAKRNIVPFGIVGEICFAGAGVVKGYLDRPELTAEKFFELEDLRYYGTGDMGRVNAAGDVEILGRRDFQIQLRGMRIELGEIEYALRKAPGVANGVVHAWADATGEKSLAAYVVFQPGHESSIAIVRQHMLDNLPDYMIPSFFVELAALPLNHNMKVDRNALPSPQSSDRRDGTSTHLRPPETATEKQLAESWKGLLGVAEVGLDDNFFELGGHSILLMLLILEVERRVGITLDGTDIMEQSLEALGASIDTRLGRPAKAVGERRTPRHSEAVSADHASVQRTNGNPFMEDVRRHVRGKEVSPIQALKIVRADYGLQALLGYRLGRYLLAARSRPYLWPLLPFGWPLYFVLSRYARLAFGINLHLSASIGPGLYIGHFGGISLRHTTLGRQCSISQLVHIGPRGDGEGPTIGDRVWIGAHATILGPYRVGDNSTVSAAAKLQRDLPARALCMGDPARVILPDYDNTGILML